MGGYSFKKELKAFRSYLKHEKSLSNSTIEHYINGLKHLIRFLQTMKIKDLSQFKLKHFNRFKAQCKKTLGKGTVLVIRVACNVFFRFLQLNHLIKKKRVFKSPLTNEMQNFINYLDNERGYSRNTLETYQRGIKRFLVYLSTIQIKAFEEVTQHVFVQFLSTLYEKGLEASSVRSHIEACKAFFKFLKREEIIQINPIKLIESPKTWQKQPDLLNPEEILQLIEKPDISTENGLRDRAIFELLYGSGLRVSELCELRVIDFRLPEKLVRIFGKGNKERVVPLTNMSIDILQQYWNKYRSGIQLQDFAFTAMEKQTRLSRCTLWNIVKKYAEQSGITKNIYCHTFRHCFATHLLDNGAEIRVIQDMLGHSDIATTGVYLQKSLKQVKEDFKNFHSRNDIFSKIDQMNEQLA